MPASFLNVAGSVVSAKPVRAEPARVGLLRRARCVSIVTSAPIAAASFTAMWPRPPSPTTPTRSPFFTFQWRSGE